MVLKDRLNMGKFFQALLLGFLAVQITSWIISSFFPDIEMFKGGPMLLLFLVIIGIISLFVLGRRLGELNMKRDLLFILLVFGAIIVLFIFLPDVIPQIFSTSGVELKEFLRENVATIIQLGPRGISYNVAGG